MIGNHLFINTDPQKVYNDVTEFIKEKSIILMQYNTNPIVVGVTPTGQANIIVYITCLIQFECTVDEWKSHVFKLNTLIKGN